MFGPLGRALPDGGDFVVDGRWPFNSGCPHANWLQVTRSLSGPAWSGAEVAGQRGPDASRPDQLVLSDRVPSQARRRVSADRR